MSYQGRKIHPGEMAVPPVYAGIIKAGVIDLREAFGVQAYGLPPRPAFPGPARVPSCLVKPSPCLYCGGSARETRNPNRCASCAGEVTP